MACEMMTHRILAYNCALISKLICAHCWITVEKNRYRGLTFRFLDLQEKVHHWGSYMLADFYPPPATDLNPSTKLSENIEHNFPEESNYSLHLCAH